MSESRKNGDGSEGRVNVMETLDQLEDEATKLLKLLENKREFGVGSWQDSLNLRLTAISGIRSKLFKVD